MTIDKKVRAILSALVIGTAAIEIAAAKVSASKTESSKHDDEYYKCPSTQASEVFACCPDGKEYATLSIDSDGTPLVLCYDSLKDCMESRRGVCYRCTSQKCYDDW